MTGVAKALYSFFSDFGIPAYQEQAVPDEAAMPYITYELKAPVWDEPTTIAASVWYEGTSFTDLNQMVDEIGEKLKNGLSVPVEGGGYLYLYKDSSFATIQDAASDKVRMAYLLIGMHALCD